MSKLFYKAMIEDIRNEKCSEAEVSTLLDAFAYTVKKTATMLARKSWFELNDYATSKQNRIDDFTLMLERKDVNGQEQLHGTFEYGRKNLTVIGILEK